MGEMFERAGWQLLVWGGVAALTGPLTWQTLLGGAVVTFSFAAAMGIWRWLRRDRPHA